MYHVGDKFIIEIDRIYKSDGCYDLYGIRGHSTLVLDEDGLMRLERPSKIEAVQTREGILIKGAKIEDVHTCDTCRHFSPTDCTNVCRSCVNGYGTADNWERNE